MIRILWLLAAAWWPFVPRQAAAQGSAPEMRRVEGSVLRPGPDGGRVPVPDVWVTLHRIARDTAGPLDSVRTDGRGHYRFSYRASGTGAAYIVTASHHGIAYFAPPLLQADVRGEDAAILVFDTTSARVPIRIRGRHLAAGAARSGRHTVIEVYELSNDSTVTRIAGSGQPTFVAPLPARARDVRIGEGDVAEDATRVESGRLLVFSPIAPGLKQLSLSYTIGSGDFPLTVPVTVPTDLFEVLLEDPRASADGAALRDLGEVTTEGRRLRRFLAQEVAPGASVTLRLPAAAATSSWGLFVTVLSGMLALTMLAAMAYALRRPPLPVLSEADRLAREIAALDARMAAQGPSEGDVRQRALLNDRLVRALASGSPAS